MVRHWACRPVSLFRMMLIFYGPFVLYAFFLLWRYGPTLTLLPDGYILENATSRALRRQRAELRTSLADARAKWNGSNSLLYRDLSRNTVKLCNNGATIHGGLAVSFRQLLVDPLKAASIARGGERLEDALDRAENDEYYSVEKGFYCLPHCHNVSLRKPIKTHHSEPHKLWLASLEHTGDAGPCGVTTQSARTPRADDSSLVVVVVRNEYANVYWNIMDLYDSFLSVFYHYGSLDTTSIIFLDAHPASSLDPLWDKMFKTVLRLYDLNETVTRFRNVIWPFPRDYSPFLQRGDTPRPFLQEFRQSVLTTMGILYDSGRPERCKHRSLNVLFVWRRDYINHPRNPSGVISRKISNERQLINVTKANFPSFHISDVQLDKLPIRRQLQLISGTDMLIGMHGAAITFALFMPPGGAVIELFPYGAGENWHMEYLAKWNGLHYQNWQNVDETKGDPKTKSTEVNPAAVITMTKDAYKLICNEGYEINDNLS